MPKTLSIEKTVTIVLIALAIASVIGFVIDCIKPFDLVAYLTGIAALAVAILTAAYVIITSRQLQVMQGQLEAMRQTYEYQSYPLLQAQAIDAKLTQPQTFFSPPDNKYSGIPRLFVTCRFINAGPHPAVGTVASMTLYLLVKKKALEINSASAAIDVVAGAGDKNESEEHKFQFMFVEEMIELMRLLRERNIASAPFLGVTLLFKNTLGGAFLSRSFFELGVNSTEDDEVLKHWHSSAFSFSTHFKTEIESMYKLKPHADDWSKIFNKVKKEFSNQIPEPSALNLRLEQIPKSFQVQAISEKIYETEASKAHFGVPIPHWVEECLIIKN